MNAENGDITAVNTVDCCTPDWFPDAHAVIFSWRPPGQKTNRGIGWTQLWRADADGKNRRLIYGEDGRHIYGGHISPDGQYALFTGNPEEDGDPQHAGAPMSLVRLTTPPSSGAQARSCVPTIPTQRPALSWCSEAVGSRAGPITRLGRHLQNEQAPPIPKGLRNKAQGCAERATLGQSRQRFSTATGLRKGAPDCPQSLGGFYCLPSAIPSAFATDNPGTNRSLSSELHAKGWIAYTAQTPHNDWDLFLMCPTVHNVTH